MINNSETFNQDLFLGYIIQLENNEENDKLDELIINSNQEQFNIYSEYIENTLTEEISEPNNFKQQRKFNQYVEIVKERFMNKNHHIFQESNRDDNHEDLKKCENLILEVNLLKRFDPDYTKKLKEYEDIYIGIIESFTPWEYKKYLDKYQDEISNLITNNPSKAKIFIPPFIKSTREWN